MKNKNLYILLCNGYYVITGNGSLKLGNNNPFVYTSRLACSQRMAMLSRMYSRYTGYTFEIIKVGVL